MRHRKVTGWPEKPRRQRKRDYIRSKNNIRRSAPVLGGRFYTYDYLHGENGWLDIYFLSRQLRVFYNATLETTARAFRGKVEDIAFDRSCLLVPYRSSLLDRLGKGNTVTTADLEEPIIADAFGGLNRRQWIEQEVARFIEEGEVTVCEQVKLDRGFSFGIGLIATLDVPVLTMETIDNFVDEFLIQWERPREGRSAAFDRSILDKTHKIESNLLVEPWERHHMQEVNT